jgi:nicotinate phosphoribosyltransferase
VEIDGIPTMKQSSNKVSYPGRKQVFRRWERGEIHSDRLGLISESLGGEQALLQLFLKQGKRVKSPASLAEISDRTNTSVASLPSSIRQLTQPQQFPVEISSALRELTEKTKR